MRIKSPLAHIYEVEPLCEAGADELFCGIEPHSWRKRYKNFSINQRSSHANFTKLADLDNAISVAHKHGVKVHVAMNAFYYLDEQYEMAERIIRDVLSAGADGIIFADPALLIRMDPAVLSGKDVVIGTDAVICNSSAVEFYRSLGATRVVLPRAMTIGEIRDVIIHDADMEYEIFIIHDQCYFEDGLCTYCKEDTGELNEEGIGRENIFFYSSSRISKRGFAGGCRSRFRRQRVFLNKTKNKTSSIPFKYWMDRDIEGCGACAIYDLMRIGARNLKVLDRNLPLEEKVKATLFIKESLGFLIDDAISKKEYVQKCKTLFKKVFHVTCNRYDCYYPSVFKDEAFVKR
ncbi:MAG: U32 family peptidase [Candidatus Omnitrophica bacterium]|nr:U32 family peptidase [Candidatus Omnitrophota bacterium]